METRKQNRLPEYDYSRAGGYFVTICVQDREKILSEIVSAPQIDGVGADAYIGPQIKLSETGKVVEKFLRNIPGIDRYVIMPNHIHMVVIIEDNGPMRASAPTSSLPQRIKSFKIMVTKTLGRAIFQRSYYEHVVRNEQDYLQICEYIENNPMKWELDPLYRK